MEELSCREKEAIEELTIYNMEEPSCRQMKAIEEIRKRMRNDLPKHMSDDNLILYRFLKARDFDVSKAQDMLRKHMSWRKHFQVDSILQDFTPRPFFEKFVKLSHLGLDRNGNMIKYIPTGKIDPRGIAKSIQINEYMKHWVWLFERIREDVIELKKQTGKTAKMTLIVDLDKLTFANATNKLAAEQSVRLLNLMQDNYPESLKVAYVINAPAYYVFLYSVIKALVSSAMIQKFQIFSHSGWQEKLLEVIDADVLPSFLGGNRTDPDGNPLCTTFVTHGGKIPELYYLPAEERDFKNPSLVKRITIPSNQKKEISVHVAEKGSRIHWEFFIKHKDIGFGLFYISSNSIYEEILPIYRYDTTDGVEKGSYKSQSCGNYAIVFDNSFSWLNSKEVEYCITLSKPVL